MKKILFLALWSALCSFAFDQKALLEYFRYASAHEGNPHGVPSSYNWYDQGIFSSLVGGENTHINWWGQVYVDESNVLPTNARVQLAGGQLWFLFEGDSVWTRQNFTHNFEGGHWPENFQASTGPAMVFRSEDPVGKSFLHPLEMNSHFWGKSVKGVALAPVTKPLKAVFSMYFVRAVPDTLQGATIPLTTNLLAAVGADWRKSDWSCPSPNGIVICTSVGIGRHVYIGRAWRTVIFHSMDQAQLQEFPTLADSIFQLPDAQWPNSQGWAPHANSSRISSSGGMSKQSSIREPLFDLLGRRQK